MSDIAVRPRNYRILRISSRGHAEAEARFYRNDARLHCCSFAEQRRAWLAEKLGHADALSRAMKSMGHEAAELIGDAEIMQRTWAWERGLDLNEKNWRMQVLIAQITEWKPEVLYLQNYDVLSRETRLNLKSLVPSLSLIVIHQQPVVPTPDVIRELATADVVLVSSSYVFQKCRDAGLDPQLVNSSFDPSVLSQLPAPSSVAGLPFYDFSFLGRTETTGGYRRRRALIEDLMPRTWLELWTPDGADFDHRVDPRRLHEPVYGLEYFKVLQRSKVAFNCSRDAASAGVDNMRLFEATGVGTCTLTDRGAHLSELFSDGVEVVTYGCSDECVENVEYLLSHESERRQIAQAGRKRTLAEHSNRKRFSQVDEILQQALAQRRRGQRTRWHGMSGSVSL